MQHDTTALYRLFDAAGRLLYVGVSANPEERLKSHASTAPWWPLVADWSITTHATRADAEAAETEAIKTERPLYNRAQSATPMNVTRDFADLGQMPIGQFRARMADVVNAAVVRGKTTYLTSNGRRVAAVIPLAEAEAIEARQQAEG